LNGLRRAARAARSQVDKMPVIIKRPRAKSDLVEIWEYIAEVP
jgi:hypothetical protein